ncbi:hypothetical protein HUA74_04340 [Myxococcus sp. CA051A]|uniref:hypothetical protein n=2 Tax=unclassified Myxococcus TaxID=2648731 RepID=UPI00157BB00D|nr:hypothetical protein [Myxococcus sp. CA033]NTX33054.1 hypothetical protein [Myxococcus sp. CA033]NTX59882.1 hypothetical protein [Myxococcus sp. CA051A]
MKLFNTFGVVGVVSLMAVGCGGEYTPEEAAQSPEMGEATQAVESAFIAGGQTRDFSTWLFGVTPFYVRNMSATRSTRFNAYCGANNISILLAPNQVYPTSLNCAWPGARLYVQNQGLSPTLDQIYVETH